MIGQAFVAASVFLCAVTLLSLLAVSASRPDVMTLRGVEWPALASASLVLCGVLAASQRDMLHAIPLLLALACASVSAITDLRAGYVFDRVTIASICAIALASVATGAQEAALFGIVAGAGTLGLLWYVSGKRGIGLGDVKLAGVIGCALGPVATLAARAPLPDGSTHLTSAAPHAVARHREPRNSLGRGCCAASRTRGRLRNAHGRRRRASGRS